MDYLVIEGYKTAAEEFSKEAGLEAPVDFDSIENRMNIREALQRGDVGDAIARVNDLNPDVSVCDCLRDWPIRPDRIKPFMHHAETSLGRWRDSNTKTSVFNMIPSSSVSLLSRY